MLRDGFDVFRRKMFLKALLMEANNFPLEFEELLYLQ
jgi:hypothetical protein